MKYADIVARWRWWIAGAALVILAAAFWSIARFPAREGAPTVGVADDGGSAPGGLPSAVQEYVQFAATARDPQSAAGGAQLVEGLRKLAAALGTLGIGGPDLPIDLRVAAEHVVLNPASTDTTATIRDDLVAVADALKSGTDTDRALREAAESIRPDRPLADQHAAVLQFFQRAAEALQRRTALTPDR